MWHLFVFAMTVYDIYNFADSYEPWTDPNATYSFGLDCGQFSGYMMRDIRGTNDTVVGTAIEMCADTYDKCGTIAVKVQDDSSYSFRCKLVNEYCEIESC